MKKNDSDFMAAIEEYGGDILRSEGMQSEKQFLQHGTTSTYAHSLAVTLTCLRIAAVLHMSNQATHNFIIISFEKRGNQLFGIGGKVLLFNKFNKAFKQSTYFRFIAH